ncbi:hypothetical protein THOB06_40003 [Vibrio rotiferianus]|nr:hypothetical protein THOG10_40003 [Vibrio rotiferianus]CAH1587578.1 hypothetical protein THOB06_40003 [Vibrio rotiferianus]
MALAQVACAAFYLPDREILAASIALNQSDGEQLDDLLNSTALNDSKHINTLFFL